MEDNTRIQQLVRKLLSGDISPEEARELNDWYDSHDIIEEKSVTGEMAGHKNSIKARMFDKLQNEIRTEKPYHHRVLASMWELRKVAAVLIIMLGGIYLVANYRTQIQAGISPVAYEVHSTQDNKRSKIVLPDGSEVWLNANSELKYSDEFNREIRKVYLKGEAFFDVVRDEEHPFIIQSKEIATTVLGTSFNVKAVAGEDITVTVATGKVQVAAVAPSENKTVLLTPNQQATYHTATQQLSMKAVDLDVYLSWKEEKLVFDEISLAKAMAILENRYGAKISIKNKSLENCIIVGEHGNESLENVLKAMQFVLDFNYTFKSPDHVEIDGGGCHQ
ncbi:FecR domain-containing protein [Fulvivirgaceae bacterium BMA12]|uniref:FecR domain-containing protein n=1 Tax=Agaribacillus aureus TaxID=3051825 RepID=A0ABT8L8L3_9BACT|nr:FecR domain-containing protein [Fulvivirgaceae bacterium BMA12]